MSPSVWTTTASSWPVSMATLTGWSSGTSAAPSLGLIEMFGTVPGAVYIGAISPKGVQLVERVGPGESLMGQVSQVQMTTGAIHFHGDVDGTNIAVNSPHSSQRLRARSGVGSLALSWVIRQAKAFVGL